MMATPTQAKNILSTSTHLFLFTHATHNLWGNIQCEMKISPAMLIKKKRHSHQGFLASKCEWGLPQLWSRRCCHFPWWLLRSWENAESNRNKETRLAPDSWGAYERNEFSEPRGLHLPIHRMLNSFTWYLIFYVKTACSLCCKLVYSRTSPPAFLERFSQSYWDTVSRTRSPKHSHEIKINSLLLGCECIFWSIQDTC